jgi:hypothetical protein
MLRSGALAIFPCLLTYDGKPLKCTGLERRILDLWILDLWILDLRILDSGYWTLDIGSWILDLAFLILYHKQFIVKTSGCRNQAGRNRRCLVRSHRHRLRVLLY